ncbi:hypothetical protein YC2023_043060 [Brassica napus]
MTEVEGVRPMAQCPRKQIFGGGGCGSDGNKTCIKSFAKQGEILIASFKTLCLWNFYKGKTTFLGSKGIKQLQEQVIFCNE